MPSITYWNRLEPSPRANDLVPSLSARIHDGLWFLTRQWQLGEFRCEDAGSAAWIEVDTTSVRMIALAPPTPPRPIDPSVPLEKLAGEALPLDLGMSVDLGQMFESMLNDAPLRDAFRAAYPIADASPAEEMSGDIELLRFRSTMAGRALDGGALFSAAAASLPSLPPQPIVPSRKQLLVRGALQRYVDAVRELFGGAPGTPSKAWDSTRLEYAYQVSIGGTGGYVVQPGDGGEASWEAFSGSTTLPAVAATEVPQQAKITRLPASVRSRSMPAHRWWDFDNATLDPGAVDVERRDLGRLVLTDLLSLHGDEWFVVPIEQKVGTIMNVDAVLVRDVFGVLTLVPPMTTNTWTAFKTSGAVPAKGTLFPATAAASVQYGVAIGEVRFVRDEMMNLVWAIEETTMNALGQPLSGHDRSLRRATPPTTSTSGTPQYVLRPKAPEHWIPYIPKAAAGKVKLERAKTADLPLRIAEEELRRSGLSVRRVVARSRGFLGHTYLWIACRKTLSPPEVTSVPRFDGTQVPDPDG